MAAEDPDSGAQSPEEHEPDRREVSERASGESASREPDRGDDTGDDNETGNREPDAPADDRHERLKRALRRGVGAGAAAYAAGYVVLYLWYWAMGDTSTETTDWVSMGWFFYRGHLVDITMSGDAAPAAVRTTESVLSATTVPDVLAPVAALTALGYLLGREAAAETALESATAGASLVAGYLPLTVVGSFLFRKPVAGGYPASPDLLQSLLLAGLAFPLLFGAIGGVAYLYREGPADLPTGTDESTAEAEPGDGKFREELEEELLEDDPSGERP
jgi:hypothetical protein